MNTTLLFCVICFFFIVYSLAEAKHGCHTPLWNAFCHMICGLLTLMILHIVSPYTGMIMPVSVLTVTAALIGGMPACVLMVFLNIFFI